MLWVSETDTSIHISLLLHFFFHAPEGREGDGLRSEGDALAAAQRGDGGGGGGGGGGGRGGHLVCV